MYEKTIKTLLIFANNIKGKQTRIDEKTNE